MIGGGPMPGSGCSTVEKRGRERHQVGGSNSCHRELGLSTLFRNFFGNNRCAYKKKIFAQSRFKVRTNGHMQTNLAELSIVSNGRARIAQ